MSACPGPNSYHVCPCRRGLFERSGTIFFGLRMEGGTGGQLSMRQWCILKGPEQQHTDYLPVGFCDTFLTMFLKDLKLV